MNIYAENPIKVAYADDHDMMREGLRSLLNGRSKVQVVLDARDGQELIDKLETAKEQPDVIILDIFMPHLDGFDTMKALRLKWPGTRILVLTGHNTDFYQVKMVMAGANGYLLKNSSPKEVEGAIQAIHETGIYRSDKINAQFMNALMKGQAVIQSLTEKEVTFLKLCCTDLTYARISEEMSITISAVDWLRDQLFKKFKVQNRPGLVSCALQYGIIPSGPGDVA